MAHISAVNEEILLRFSGSVLRFDDESADGHQFGLCVDIHKGGSVTVFLRVAEDGFDTLFLCAYRQLKQDFVIVNEGKGYFRIDKHDMVELVEQIA